MKRRRQQLNTKQNRPQQRHHHKNKKPGQQMERSWCQLSKPVCYLLSPRTAKLSSQGICSNDGFNGLRFTAPKFSEVGVAVGLKRQLVSVRTECLLERNPLSQSHTPLVSSSPPRTPNSFFYFI